MSTIYIGSDHAGFDVKEEVKSYLTSGEIAFTDLGCDNTDSVDYPDYAAKLARAVAGDEGSLGILICGTGIGVSIAANKVKGIRAALCHTEFEADMCRRHNNANVICFGARTTGPALIQRMVDCFLSEKFEGGRHGRRVDKINALDA